MMGVVRVACLAAIAATVPPPATMTSQKLSKESRVTLRPAHGVAVLEDRSERASTLITSQVPVKAWHDLIGEPTIADSTAIG
jgi:hypothetical protein